MATVEEKYIPKDNRFYENSYPYFIIGLMAAIGFLMLMTGVVFYQMFSRPLPPYYAVQPTGEKLALTPYTEPSLLSVTILRFASKAATSAYTFDFVNYDKQIALARSYFTDSGWKDFNDSIKGLLSTIVSNQLFVNGVVAGPPVISNEGPLPGIQYAWRVQIPFLVTYQSANTTTKQKMYVMLTIVRVPTTVNPQGIGIEQFVMTGA